MAQTTFLLTLVSVMIAAGALGGVINYFLNRKTDPEGTNIGKSVTVGIGAAFLVPLFLNMISSNLTEMIRGNTTTPADLSKILVFAGFCLIAAISSTAFIKTLSDRVLKEAQEAKKVARSAEQKASAAQSVIAPIVAREIEEDESVTSGLRGLASAISKISEKEHRLLEKLAIGKLFRTRTSLAKELGLAKSDVDQMMEELKQKGLVDSKLLSDADGAKKRRWYISNKGREAITSASDLETGSPL
jgi:DNA-binding MarR family transcriptional regulator